MPVDPELIRRLVKERPYSIVPEDQKPLTQNPTLTFLKPVADDRKLFPLDCVHLGSAVPPPEGQSPKKEWRQCNAGKGVVCRCNCGPGKCELYTADIEEPETIRAGVVISHYGMPAIVDLQIRLIRATCGDVPIMVGDDNSPNSDELAAICAVHKVEIIKVHRSRVGHAGGCVGSTFRGLHWAKRNGLKVLCKLSQRFLITKENWLSEGAEALVASGLSTFSDSCIEGRSALPIRSEAMLLDVNRWTQEHVLKVLRPRRVFPYSGEAIYAMALQRIGGGFGVWKLLNGPDRSRKAPNVLWHVNTPLKEYKELAAKFGVDLGPEFFVAGWPKNEQSDWG